MVIVVFRFRVHDNDMEGFQEPADKMFNLAKTQIDRLIAQAA